MKTLHIIKLMKEYNNLYNKQIICIGGLACYLYTKKYLGISFTEETDDGDFLISQEAFYILKNKNIISNPRMKMKRLYVDDIKFDIYVEYQNNIPVVFKECIDYAEEIDNILLIDLKNLIKLKFDTVFDRPKSQKNWRDLVKMSVIIFLKNKNQNIYTVEQKKFIAKELNDFEKLFKDLPIKEKKFLEGHWKTICR